MKDVGLSLSIPVLSDAKTILNKKCVMMELYSPIAPLNTQIANVIFVKVSANNNHHSSLLILTHPYSSFPLNN